MKNTYKVPEQNFETLQARLAKLAHRCDRINVTAPTLTVEHVIEEMQKPVEAGLEPTKVLRFFIVTLEGENPKIGGYEFIGTISPVTDEAGALLGNILKMIPGNEAPAQFREAKNYCDHCKTERRRNETFIIKSADGFRQIGRNCLANYLGLGDPHSMAELAQILIDAAELCELSEDGERDGFRSYVPERVPLEDVLITAAAAIRLYGWLSNKSAKEFDRISTSNRVNSWMLGGKKTRDEFEHPLIPTDADKTLAANTGAWLETLGSPDNDYLFNLSLLAKSVSITSRNFGIAVSAINAYSRAMEVEIRRNKRIADGAKSQYVGTEGERLDFEALVVYTKSIEREGYSYYDSGISYLYKMVQNDNVITYFSSRDLGWEQGATVKFKATVKKHEEYEGVKQTIVTRATLPKYLTKAEKKGIKLLAHARKYIDQLMTTEGYSIELTNAINALYAQELQIKNGELQEAK